MSKKAVISVFLSLIGIISMGSAVVAFSYITSVGAITKTSWRLQITTACFGLSILFKLKNNSSSYQASAKKYLKHMIFSGLSLGSHFIFWNISLKYTSVAHSMVFLYSCPILLVIYYFAVKKSLSKAQVFGALLGFTGLALMCFMANSSEGSSWYGDLISFCGALVLCVNLILSEKPMAECPLLYLFSIHLISSLFCTVLSACLESRDSQNIVAFFYEFQGVYALYLGVVCGFIGNSAIYYLLKHVDPFVVSVIINFDPVVGSLFAWVFGLLSNPGIFTYIGGSLVVCGNLIATGFSKGERSGDSEKIDSTDNANLPCVEMKRGNGEVVVETSQIN